MFRQNSFIRIPRLHHVCCENPICNWSCPRRQHCLLKRRSRPAAAAAIFLTRRWQRRPQCQLCLFPASLSWKTVLKITNGKWHHDLGNRNATATDESKCMTLTSQLESNCIKWLGHSTENNFNTNTNLCFFAFCPTYYPFKYSLYMLPGPSKDAACNLQDQDSSTRNWISFILFFNNSYTNGICC